MADFGFIGISKDEAANFIDFYIGSEWDSDLLISLVDKFKLFLLALNQHVEENGGTPVATEG